jgi:hypothetical protein
MRKLFPMLAVAVLFSSFALYVRAAAEVTIKGEGKCAKCSLKETKTCQNTITTEKDGKKVVYYIKNDAVAKAFHKNICQDDTKTIQATGTVSEVDGKQVLTASKIEVVEE